MCTYSTGDEDTAKSDYVRIYFGDIPPQKQETRKLKIMDFSSQKHEKIKVFMRLHVSFLGVGSKYSPLRHLNKLHL